MNTFVEFLRSTPEQVGALVISGAAGAYVRAIFAPETSWKRRVLEGIAGAFSAIFLGGLVGHLLDLATGAGVWAYLTSGFVMGESGIAGVRAVRQIVLKEPKK